MGKVLWQELDKNQWNLKKLMMWIFQEKFINYFYSFIKTVFLDISWKSWTVKINLLLFNNKKRFVHTYTLYHVYRPFGSSVMFACYDKYNGYKLYMVEPSGLTYVFLKNKKILKFYLKRLIMLVQ